MKKQRLLKKALRIICVQQGITYQNVADKIGITKGKLLYAIDKEYDDTHEKICKYAKKNIELYMTPKIHCILNDISFREYCNINDIGYQDFIYERI